MKKIILIIGCSILSMIASAQTYSKLYNLTEELNGLDSERSILRDMILKENNIYVHIEHLCKPDSSDHNFFCTGVYDLSIEGDIVARYLLDSIFPQGTNRMTTYNNNILVAGIEHGSFEDHSTQLNLLDLNGDVTKRNTGLSRVLLASSTGDVYCFSERNPAGQILQSHGRVNKYDEGLDTLLWSAELPFNNFTNVRRYEALNMIETQSGDILVCGTVFDEGPDGPIANGYDHTWNGFITRLDTDGNILWLRLYKTDNNYPLVPKSEYGRFLNSTIWNIHELEDGRIVTGGTSYHTGWQNDIIRPAGETDFYAWLMTVNADGCLDGEECDEVIILDGEYRQKDGYLPIITSEQTWIGQGGGATAPANSFQYTYSDDSLLIDTNLYYERIQSNEEDGSESYIQGYYRELEGKVYQKFEGNFNEEVIFDITLMEGDTFPIMYDVGDNALVVVTVDTVIFEDNVPRKRIELQCAENSDWFGSLFWIEGIGELYSGTECVLDGADSWLRCVLDDDGARVYSAINENENCWIITSTADVDDERFLLLPNPTNDEFRIVTDRNILKIEIYDVTGQLEKIVNNSNSVRLSYLQSGVYHIIIHTGEGVAMKRVVKI